MQGRGFRAGAFKAAVVAVLIVASAGGLGLAPAGAVGGPPAGGAARIEPWLAGQVAAASPSTKLVVLVGADGASTATAAIVKAGATPIRTFERIGFSAAIVTPDQVRRIHDTPGVRYLQGNRPLDLAGTSAQQTTRVLQTEQVFTAPDGSALDGHGVGIAVVDSGMAGDHPMYRDAADTGTRLLNIKQACANVFDCDVPGNVNDLYFADFTGKDTDVLALGGHGTHVTGIAGGREVTTSDGVPLRGTAKASSIYGLGAGAGLFTLSAASSLNWVLEHHADPCAAFTPRPAVVGGCAPIKVVNNSYGSPGDYSPDDVFSMLSERLVLDGVVVVWAAGNGDEITNPTPRPNDGTVNLSNPPGQSPLPGVVMVANYDDNGTADRDNALNSSSSRGLRGAPETYPDVAAPGTSILSACRPYLPVCTSAESDPDYGAISGTSMAAPHVAGLIAILLQAHPELTPAQVEDLIEDTAHQFGDLTTYEADTATSAAFVPGQVRNGNHPTSFDKGHGLVDLTAAIASAENIPDPGPDGSDPCAGFEVITDPEGDATALTGIGPNAGVGLPTPDVDMTAVRASELGNGDVRLQIDVADLPAAPLSAGDAVRSFFTANAVAYTLDLNRDHGANGPVATSVLSVPDPTDPTGVRSIVIARNFPVVFDADADTLTTDLPGAIVAVGAGERLQAVRVLWRRSFEAAAAPADSAQANCPLTITADGLDPVVPEVPLPVLFLLAGLGLGAIVLYRRRGVGQALAILAVAGILAAGVSGNARPALADTLPPVAFGAGDGNVQLDTPIASLQANTTCVTATDGKVAGDPGANTGCTVLPFTVGATPAQPLRYLEAQITPTGTGGGADDIDLYVLAADGTVMGDAANPALVLQNSNGTEHAFVRNLAPGDYRLVIQAFQTGPEATAHISLKWWARSHFVD